MAQFAPKTIRGKLLFAYLALLAIFFGAGLLILLQLSGLRRSSAEFFAEYSDAEDMIIATRFLVGEISNTVLLPPRSLDIDTYSDLTRTELLDASRRIQQSILDDGQKNQLVNDLEQYIEAMLPVMTMHHDPVQRMEEADAIAEKCLHQAEAIHNVVLVNAISGIVDSYTDTLLASASGEREQFDRLVKIVESHAASSSVPDFPQLKQAARQVFLTNDLYVQAVDRFRNASSALSRQLASVDKQFHADFLLPRQQKLVEYAQQSAWVILFSMLFTFFMATVISLLLKKYIWRPLVDMGGMVTRLSEGDLNHRLPSKGEDEVSVIGKELNRFADHLKATLEQLDRQMVEMTAVEASLRKSEEHNRSLSEEYQYVLNGISEALMVIDQKGQVVWANEKATEELYGEIDRQVSSGDYELYDSSFYYLGTTQVAACFNSAEKTEELIRTEAGQYFRVKVFPLFNKEGAVDRVLKIVNNVSEQYLLKEEADRAHRLASLGELAVGIAHEINNPNSLILLNTPVARDAFEEMRPILENHFRQEGDFRWGGLPYSRMREELPQMMAEMYDGALRIQRIVEDLKNFVRNSDDVSLEKVDLNISVETGLRLVRSLVKKSTDNYSCELKKRLPLIFGSPVPLEQVVVNLVQNACLALPDRSRGLTVRTALSDDREEVLLIVRDEGVGISPENIMRITDPFFTTRRKEGGTGLGLSVTSRIVRDFGGHMQFTSKPGEGTTVTVRFPIAK